MTLSVKHLPHQHEDMCLSPMKDGRHHGVWDLKSGEVETGGIRGLMGQAVSAKF